MLADIRRFYREAPRDVEVAEFKSISLGDYLTQRGYGSAFRDDHLLPMASAIWSASPSDMLAYPASSFIRFHTNHGLLQITGRPIWETVSGGSISYVRRLIAPIADKIKYKTAVVNVQRSAHGVRVIDSKGGAETFDHVVMATHADQALTALSDPSALERTLLGAFRYNRSLAVLHSDESFMPKRRAAWASWNYLVSEESSESATVTYNMNILQGLQSRQTWCVTLNQTDRIREDCIKGVYHYDHPLFTLAGVAAQRRWHEINGINGTWYCGAWWRNGFHEDGVWSAQRVAEAILHLHERPAQVTPALALAG